MTNMMPDPYSRPRIYVTAQTDDDFPFVLKYAGEDKIVIGTDYGHTDASSQVDAISVFRGNNEIDEGAKRKILDDNPRALYAMRSRVFHGIHYRLAEKY
jgi:predicted TIM-barrel fold metal-dependent hydrolase